MDLHSFLSLLAVFIPFAISDLLLYHPFTQALQISGSLPSPIPQPINVHAEGYIYEALLAHSVFKIFQMSLLESALGFVSVDIFV